MNETGRCQHRSGRPSPDFLDDDDRVGGAGVPAKRLIGVAVAVLLAAGVVAGAALAASGPPAAPPAGPALPPAPPLPAAPADEPPAKKKFDRPARPDDERVKAAQAKKDALERSERALAKAAALGLGESLTKVQATVDGMKPADLTDEQAAVTELRRGALEVRGLARDILAKEPEYKRLVANYHAELKAAPGAFVPAAEVFEQMAEEEPVKEFKERYRRLGKSLRDLAKVMERRALDLAGEEKEVAEAYRYVAAADRYLTSLCEWLGTYPSFASGLERQKQVQELRSFIRYFRQLDAALDKFNKKVAQPGAATP